MQFSFKKSLDFELENMGLPYSYWDFTLWYTGLRPEKYLNQLIEIGLILWYIGDRFKNYSFRLVLYYMGLGLEKYLA